jgi:hypothetical protein
MYISYSVSENSWLIVGAVAQRDNRYEMVVKETRITGGALMTWCSSYRGGKMAMRLSFKDSD